MSSGKAVVAAIIVFLALLAAVLLFLHFLGILILAIAFLGLLMLVGIIAAIVIIGLLFILLVPYYILTKEPVVEQGGDYRIENIEGKEDWPKTK
ncbi:MAG: hypothetical protein ACE5IJ_06715 [Thermoplasmata archaeon]